MFPFTVRHPIPPVELAPGIAMSFEVIPPVPVQEAALASGQPLSFMMGSRDGPSRESPRHRVVIPQPFYLGTFPVTQREFAVWTGSKAYVTWWAANQHLLLGDRKPHGNYYAGKKHHPAENLSWYEAMGFVAWLNAMALLPQHMKDFRARLPSEAEWEYACRAGTDTEYYSGDGEAALEQIGWYDGNSNSSTHPVGLKPGNPWGLHDVHGNVMEWCGDVYDSRAYSKRGHLWLAEAWSEEAAGDDAERSDGVPRHVVRGGSWNDDPDWCRAARRARRHPGLRIGGRGFRVLLGLPGPAEPEHQLGGAGREGAGGRDDRPGDRKAGAAPRRREAKRATPRKAPRAP
jgi:formylglycine-generating enzyme required for sulfatase activity